MYHCLAQVLALRFSEWKKKIQNILYNTRPVFVKYLTFFDDYLSFNKYAISVNLPKNLSMVYVNYDFDLECYSDLNGEFIPSEINLLSYYLFLIRPYMKQDDYYQWINNIIATYPEYTSKLSWLVGERYYLMPYPTEEDMYNMSPEEFYDEHSYNAYHTLSVEIDQYIEWRKERSV